MKIFIIFGLSCSLFLGLFLTCFAEDKKSEQDVLDFEADVIQGERKKPDVFLQLSKQNQTLESIIYMRKDFKDFHSLEKNWRPSYLELRRAPIVKK